jgi:hypothetical protein
MQDARAEQQPGSPHHHLDDVLTHHLPRTRVLQMVLAEVLLQQIKGKAVDVFEHKENADNCYSYIKTRFFRFLCQPTIVSPDVSQRSFELVPQQDFSKPWTDEELYIKYGLTQEEIEFIESMIRPME